MNTPRLAVLALFALPLLGQLDTGALSGRITDSSGAVVPNAQVGVLNLETNFASDTVTNSEGLFRVSSLRPGPYRISVTASGFKQHVRQGVDLRVGDNLEVSAVLEVGGTTESVVVTAEALQLETETSVRGSLLEGNYIQQLPLYQRNVKATFYLLPNVDVQGFGYSGNLQDFHIDGLKSSNIGYFQDGVYAVGNNNGTIYTSDPIQSTVQEVRVVSSALPAEYGHSSGGAMTAVQRSGTNVLHGEASMFGRVSALQHRKYFDLYHFGQQQPGQVATPSELFMQPNATISGPVVLPKIYNGKNRTFFLFAVERLIEKQAKQQAYTVPDAAELRGDFSFAGQGVTPNQLFDPLSTSLVNGQYTRSPIPGNVIPTSRIDPVAQKFLSLQPYALPNTNGTYSNTGPANNFQGTYLKKVFWENYTARVDQQFTSGFKMNANWAYNSRYQRSPNPQIANPLFDASLNTEQDYQNTASIGATKVISPTLINETRIGYYRFEANVASPDANKNLGQLLGIPNISGALLPGGLPLGVAGFSENVIENFTFKDDLTWIRSNHSFKFGYDLLFSRQNGYGLGSSTGTVNNPSGNFNFTDAAGLTGNGTTTIANTGGISFANFLLGSVSSATFSLPTASYLPRDSVNSFYAQDDWKVTSRLTLNLGVRWAMESPWHYKYGQFSNFDLTAADNVVSGGRGLITHPGGNLTNREWQRPEPRVGIAWHPLEKLVVRTGFSFMHADLGLAPNQLDEYSISTTQSQLSGNPTPIYQISRGPNPIVYPNLTAQGTQPYQGTNYSSRSTTYTNPNLKNPYTMTWNFGLQYQLKTNVLMELLYEGSAGVGFLETPQYNTLPEDYQAGNTAALAALVGNSQAYRPYTNFGTINYRTNVSHSTFHSGTVKVQKRLSNGFTYDSFFTFAKSLDNAGVGNVLVSPNLYKGPSNFDRKYRYVGDFSYEVPFGKGRTFMNRGGILNTVLGDYTLVWQYDVYSGNPVTLGVTNSPYTYLPTYMGITGRPNVLGPVGLRDNWQDLGGDRFNQGNQNSMICCLSNLAYAPQYGFGNAGRNTLYTQRGIGASFSLRKEIALKERLKMQLRFDFQNPFKWYNWGNPTLNVDLKNVVAGTSNPTAGNLFGKVPSANEATSVADGGVPMMNITIKLIW